VPLYNNNPYNEFNLFSWAAPDSLIDDEGWRGEQTNMFMIARVGLSVVGDMDDINDIFERRVLIFFNSF
jgi:hypothetical protein